MNMVTESTTTAIIVYGRSDLLDNVELTLRKNAGIEPYPPLIRLFNINAPTPLQNVPTGVIIYDQNCADPTAVYQLLSNYPGWQLIGLTVSSEGILIINNEKKNGRFSTNAIEIIQQITKESRISKVEQKKAS